MKRFVTVFMLICIFASLFTVNAFAAGELTVGMMKITDNSDREAFGVFYSNPVYEAESPKYIAEDPSSFHIDLYSGTEKLAIVEPKLPAEYPDTNFALDSAGRLVVDSGKSATSALFVLDGSDVSGSWKVKWLVLPTENRQPDNAKVYVDNLSGEGSFTSVQGSVTGLDSVTAPIAVRDANGQPIAGGFVKTLEEAVAVAGAATIEIRKSGTYTLPKTDKNLTIKADGVAKADVIVKADFPVANMSNLNLDAVTVQAPAPVYVPATADNSQMGLWCVLFAALAVTAMLTRKKRTA